MSARVAAFLIALALAGGAGFAADGTPAPRGTVWFFIAVDCPIANGYAPEISRIVADFESQGIAFLLVYPEPSLSEASITRHREEYQLPAAFHHDRDHQFVLKSGVTTTPEVAVFDAAENLVYRGRIDDRYTDFGDRKNAPKVTDLRDILKQLTKGNRVEFRETTPIGCFIETLKEN